MRGVAQCGAQGSDARTGYPRALEVRRAFRIGDVEIRPASNEIVTKEGVVRVKPRLMEVLLRLAVEPGQVVSRQTLLDDVWPRRMVNDDVLSRVVADLRVALRDDAREARYIETLPKAGYRLIAPVVRQPSPAAAPGATPAPVPAARPSHWAAYATAAAVAVSSLRRCCLVPRPDGWSDASARHSSGSWPARSPLSRTPGTRSRRASRPTVRWCVCAGQTATARKS